MTTSKVSICNAALAKIGAEPIASLEEDTKRARFAAAAYDPVLAEVLAEHAWPFALARASLARLADAPLYGFSYAYQLPTDFIALVDTSAGPGLAYQIEGRELLTDADTVMLRYVRRVTDPALFHSAFSDLLSTRLAAELALAITRKSADYEAAMTLYRARLAEVRGIASGSQGVAQDVVPSWTEGR